MFGVVVVCDSCIGFRCGGPLATQLVVLPIQGGPPPPKIKLLLVGSDTARQLRASCTPAASAQITIVPRLLGSNASGAEEEKLQQRKHTVSRSKNWKSTVPEKLSEPRRLTSFGPLLRTSQLDVSVCDISSVLV